ncbi:CPBP family intramembrane glutamic endopeptidase [Planococcus plakortidis]|uniref:CPBP family intramembrane glutamic endopeptidase n=1 Tax=Planococcus plakortidis TaxID=1038856 RepID=UPI003984933A
MAIAILFFLGIAAISYQLEVLSLFIFTGFVIWLFVNNKNRFLISLLLSFLIGFAVFIIANGFVETMVVPQELKIILNRLFLGFILIGIVFNHLLFKKKLVWYNRKPDWTNPVRLPFHHVNVFWFWLIGIAVNGIVYSFFIARQDLESIQSLLVFCLVFSLINAVFEEVIWRGIMLAALQELVSAGYAVAVTSIGFGLLHLAIGFPVLLSLVIALAGVIYAVITLKTNSIYPSIIFHFVINIGMVYSGLII